MLKVEVNYRQADMPMGNPAATVAVKEKPVIEFKSPQEELLHIKETDCTLNGFARVYRILEKCDFFEFNQNKGVLDKNWLTVHDCSKRVFDGCMGSVLRWFFADSVFRDFYQFTFGIHRLASHLNVNFYEIDVIINRAARSVAEKQSKHFVEFKPFAGDWTVDPALVFEELARRYPGK